MFFVFNAAELADVLHIDFYGNLRLDAAMSEIYREVFR